MKLQLLDELRQRQEAKQPVVLVTRLGDGRQRLLNPRAEPADPLATPAADALRADRSTEVEQGGETYFLQVFNPPLRLLVVGAVHIAQALVPMAQLTGYAVTVIDPRQAFLTAERFPDIERLARWPDKALADLGPDRRTALVTLSHDPKIDEPALIGGLNSEVFYIGALGSKRTHASRVERLTEKGLSEERLGRIHAPIGLSIGARSPAEIAVSILAEITQTLRQVSVS